MALASGGNNAFYIPGFKIFVEQTKLKQYQGRLSFPKKVEQVKSGGIQRQLSPTKTGDI